MKIKVLSSVCILFILGSLSSFAANKTEKISVNGKCDMCKNRIETVVKSIDGVESANWDVKFKKLEVTYDDSKITSTQIQTSLAMAGHDTELFSASNKRYSQLPGCCQYLRYQNRNKLEHGSYAGGASPGSPEATECNHDISPNSGSCCEK